jgi:hypothetical protein
MPKLYLGDSVYAAMTDTGAVLLTTENGQGPSNSIYLEPEVLRALIVYWERAVELRRMAQARAAIPPETRLARGWWEK